MEDFHIKNKVKLEITALSVEGAKSAWISVYVHQRIHAVAQEFRPCYRCVAGSSLEVC